MLASVVNVTGVRRATAGSARTSGSSDQRDAEVTRSQVTRRRHHDTAWRIAGQRAALREADRAGMPRRAPGPCGLRPCQSGARHATRRRRGAVHDAGLIGGREGARHPPHRERRWRAFRRQGREGLAQRRPLAAGAVVTSPSRWTSIVAHREALRGTRTTLGAGAVSRRDRRSRCPRVRRTSRRPRASSPSCPVGSRFPRRRGTP